MGVADGREPRGGADSEERDCSGFSGRGGIPVPGVHAATVFAPGVAAAASVERAGYHALDRRAVARAGDAAQSAVFRFHHAQRARGISRIPVVLFHERTGPALPEFALSARLQYGAARIFLAVSFILAVSLERILSGHRETEIQTAGPRRSNAIIGAR